MVVPDDVKRQGLGSIPAQDAPSVSLVVGRVQLAIGVIDADKPQLFKQELEMHRQRFEERTLHFKSLTAEGEAEQAGVKREREEHQQVVDVLSVLISLL